MRNFLLLHLVLLLACATVNAEVILDGTLGSNLTLQGPKYEIDAKLGQQHGSNLFHSFEKFNINNNEKAIFSGYDNINNIINRVTGGMPSSIDGSIESDIEADIYLINPAGLIFGPNAKLNVQGSFHASTADTLRFQDGSEFNAQNPSSSSLTMAPVSTFGFLTDSPRSLTIEGSDLEGPLGKSLSFIGGDVIVSNDAFLYTESGYINIVSVANKADVALLPQDLILSTKVGGNITLRNSQLIADGKGGSSIFIRGGQFLMDSTEIGTETSGSADDGEISVQVDDLTVKGGKFSSITAGTGQSSNVKIQVMELSQLSGGRIELESFNEGDVGSVDLETGTLHLKEGAYIKTFTGGSGQGGNISIRATDTVMLSGTDSNSGDGSYIATLTNGNSKDAGSGGKIVLETKQLSLMDGAQITSNTAGAGKGGVTEVKVADSITLSDNSKMMAATSNSGNGGRLEIVAKQLTLQKGSDISGSSSGTGQGGDINIQVKDLVKLEGVNSEGTGNRIMANAQGKMAEAGDSGTLTLKAGRLELSDGAQIGTSTFGPGNAGTLDVQVEKEAIFSGQDQSEKPFHSGLFISSQSETDNAGDGGYINFRVGDLHLTKKGEIFAETWGSGTGGNIKIDAQTINLASGGRITAHSREEGLAGEIALTIRDRLQMHDSQIETSAQSADGGNLAITASNYIYLVNSKITTSVSEEFGEGGNIDLNPEFVVLNGSEIIAKAKKGKGGDINITTTGIYNFSGEPIEKVINASSEYNEDGIITINTPDNNGEEGLLVLPSTFVDASALLDTPCSHRIAENLSSFATVPTEGITNAPNDLLSNPALLLKPSPLNPVAATKKPGTTATAKPSMVALTTACHPNNSTTQKPQLVKKSHLISEQLF